MVPFIYRSPLAYAAIMRALYGRHAQGRFQAIAAQIQPGASVLDVCCGPGWLGDYLSRRDLRYEGIDASPAFVRSAMRRGLRVRLGDARDGLAARSHDVVVMQSSLYQFAPAHERMVEQLLAAARRQVIIAEPVQNLSSSKLAWVARAARLLTATEAQGTSFRFDEASLARTMERWRERVQHSAPLAGGRERLFVLAA